MFAILYYWSRCEPEARLSIYGFSIPGYQFPFFMMGYAAGLLEFSHRGKHSTDQSREGFSN